MSAGAIAGAASTLTNPSAGNGLEDISSDQFMKILIAELSQQDPFEPQDSGALLEQLSALRNIESQINLQEQIEGLVLQNSVSGAANLIGKEVDGLDTSNTQVTGVVTSVRVQEGKAILELSSGRTLPIDRVSEIRLLNDAA